MRIPTLLDLTTPGAYGHAHFWERAMSRRQFIGTAATASGAALTASMWMPALVEAAGDARPRPIPEFLTLPDGTVLKPFHVQLAGFPGMEPSAITDFKGVVGAALINGKGRRTDEDGEDSPLGFDTDLRIMQGEYISLSGQHRTGTFSLV
jgi:hypothetical protein